MQTLTVAVAAWSPGLATFLPKELFNPHKINSKPLQKALGRIVTRDPSKNNKLVWSTHPPKLPHLSTPGTPVPFPISTCEYCVIYPSTVAIRT